MAWNVYIIECGDTTLYTGITNDLDERIKKHTEGTGAKYTRGRGPFTVLFCESYQTKGEALKRELEIKALSRAQKLALICGLE